MFLTSALWWRQSVLKSGHLPVELHKLQQALDEAAGLAQPHAKGRLDRQACLNGSIAGGLLSTAFAHRNDRPDTIQQI